MAPPHDDFSEEDRLADLLADYSVAPGGAIPRKTWAELSPDQRNRFQAYREVIDRLEDLWPRSKPSLTQTPINPDVAFPFAIGRFEVKKILGTGGCGVVFLADDPLLARHVALKVPRPAGLANPDLLARFLREAQAAAILSHPNLVPVYEASTVDGLYYIAAEYCDGPTLAQWFQDRGTPLPVEHAARLVATLATGIGYAHDRGVIHRDLKPSNILLFGPTTPDVTLCQLTPKITDFGFAKLLERDDDGTYTGVVIGTPQYMAPEQAEGRRTAIGPATDVYALGVILYEALIGSPPLRGTTHPDTLRRVVAEAPTPPRAIRREIPNDLEAVCLRCLEKDPKRRYPDGDSLAADLNRFLEGRPTLARPVRSPEKLVKWVRRNPLVASLTAWLVFACSVAGYFALREFYQTRELNRNLRDALDRESAHVRALRQANYIGQIQLVDYFSRHSLHDGRCETLIKLLPEPGQTDLRDFAWHYHWQQVESRLAFQGRGGRHVYSIAVAPDHTRLASAHQQAGVLVHDRVQGRLIAAIDTYPYKADVVTWGNTPNELVIAESSQRGDPDETRPQVRVEIRIIGESNPRHESLTPFQDVVTILPLPGEQYLLGGKLGQDRWGLAVWSPAGKTLRTVLEKQGVITSATPGQTPDEVVVASYHLNQGKGLHCEIHRLKPQSTNVPRLVGTGAFPFFSVELSPDGRTLAAMADNSSAAAWDFESGKLLWKTPPSSRRGAPRIGWISNNELVANQINGEGDGTNVKLSAQGVPIGTPEVMTLGVSSLAACPKTGEVYLGCSDGSVRRWGRPTPGLASDLVGHQSEVWGLNYSPDGKFLASSDDAGLIKIWDTASRKLVTTLSGHTALVMAVAYSPDGKTLASASWDQTVRLWDPTTGEEKAMWTAHNSPVQTIQFSPDGRMLATKGRDEAVKLWDVATHSLIRKWPTDTGRSGDLVFCRNGTVLATTRRDVIELWDIETGQLRFQMAQPSSVWSLAASPEGDWLVSGESSGSICAWDTRTGDMIRSWWGHQGGVRALAVDPTGRTVASGGFDNLVKVWHAESGQPLLALQGHRENIFAVRFSPTESVLASCSHDGSVKLWPGR